MQRILDAVRRGFVTFILPITVANVVGAQTAPLITVHPISGFGTLDVAATSLHGQNVILSGAELAVLFNHRVSIGLAGYGLVNGDVPIRATGTATDTLRFGYGGVRIGCRDASNRPIHIGIDVLVGGGEASSRSPNTTREEDEVFVAVPSLSAEIGLLPSMRLVASASYRFVSGVDWPGASRSSLAGAEARLSLRFGRF